jgi:NAD(P)-dependent dehydrogenase (short-subunit alcohol dehydrogenase family)
MKQVIITGAGGFLGTATARLFLDKGYKVIAMVHGENALSSFAETTSLQKVVADLSDATNLQPVIDDIITKNGKIDACLLLAGGYGGGDLLSTTIEQVREQIALNFDTAYNVVHALYAHLKENGHGRIILVGSQPPLMPKKATKSVAYSLSKSLLFQLAAILNEDSKGTDVVTHVVVPSTIDTEANRKSMPDADHSKWVRPEQLAQAMELLCSDATSAWRESVIKVYNNVV